MNALTILFLGFILGLKHATDADHVVAVTTIVSRARKLRHAAMVGITWGIGHSLMIIIVGIAIILFHISIPERLQLSFEFIVAVALIVLGVLNLTGIMQKLLGAFSHVHSHFHNHNKMHTHVHHHDAALHGQLAKHEEVTEFIARHGAFGLIRPLVVGLIHGLAGSAAVALLILGSIADEKIAMLYLAIFGAGTVIGMMCITTLLGIPIIAGSKKFSQFDRVISIAAGALSIAYGIYFGYTIGVTQGLFRLP